MLNDKKPEAVNGSKDMKGNDYELYIYGYRYIYRVVMMKGLSAKKSLFGMGLWWKRLA